MSSDAEQRQQQNTAKLVMSAFYKVANDDGGTTAEQITRYLQEKFGDVWKSSLTGKAEETLKQSAALGFLERHGDRYIAKMARETGCRRKRRRKRRNSCRRRRRRRGCGQRRRRRKRSCCCSKTK